MYGAILGDIIGAPYEFRKGPGGRDFPLFVPGSQFTDDSVMTVAVAEALLDTLGQSDDQIRAALVRSMQKWGRRYPGAGYGRMFLSWIRSPAPKPYGSFGNGSAMRVSSAGWLFGSLGETRHAARLTAEVTHNHPEGIKGAEATASAIYLARTGAGKQQIREYITGEFGYDLSCTCDEIRPGYCFKATCQETVPEAVTAFLEGGSFEDVIRLAVSLGGDCDTLTCIAGSIAEAFYGVPDALTEQCRRRIPRDMQLVIDRFLQAVPPIDEHFFRGNEIIEAAIDRAKRERTEKSLLGVLEALRRRMREDGHFMIPVIAEGEGRFAFRTLTGKDGKTWLAAFTSRQEYAKGEPSGILSNFIDTTLAACLDSDEAGFVINPWSSAFLLPKEIIAILFSGGEQGKRPRRKASAAPVSPGRTQYDPRRKAAGIRPVAKKSDWKTLPMPDRCADFTMTRHLTAEQLASLRRGNIPQEMEDKWFWYMEGNTLYAHRSWTGICAFILRFRDGSDEIRVTVNRDPEQVTGGTQAQDTEEINHLLDWWIRPEYDYYGEWLSETKRTLDRQGTAPDGAEDGNEE